METAPDKAEFIIEDIVIRSLEGGFIIFINEVPQVVTTLPRLLAVVQAAYTSK